LLVHRMNNGHGAYNVVVSVVLLVVVLFVAVLGPDFQNILR